MVWRFSEKPPFKILNIKKIIMAKFIRKSPDTAGIHMIKLKERAENGKIVTDRIILKGREIYDTDDKKEIALLQNDECVEEVNRKTKIEVKETE